MVSAINKKLTSLIDERDCEFAVMYRKKKGILFPVDNTTAGAGDKEDPIVNELRQKIEGFMNDFIASKVTNNCLPVTWMILELELQELHEDGTKCIKHERYTKIATEKASIVPEEVEESIQYFNFVGVFLHFKEVSGLCDYVIIDHQWLFDSLAMIMHLSPDDIDFNDHRFEKQFEEKRLFAKTKLCNIHWNNELPAEYFFNLLIFLKVIATVKLNEEEYYYMPCILSSINQYHDKYRFLCCEPLLVQFSSGFLPRGFFCSLVVHLLEKLPTGWNHQLHNTEQFSNLITFQLQKQFVLRLHDKTSYLEIQIRHYKGDLPICDCSEIFAVLSQYFKDVCIKLNFNHKKLQYGFLCHDGETNDDHIVMINPFETPLPSELICRRSSHHPTELGKLHKVWFEKVSYVPGNKDYS